jgi:hypothetical protein
MHHFDADARAFPILKKKSIAVKILSSVLFGVFENHWK